MSLADYITAESTNATQKSHRVFGLAFAAITGFSAIAVSVVATPFIVPAFRKICIPYVPATSAQLNNVMKALRGRTGNVVDLGSGDGRVVIEAAKHGFKSMGIELNPVLVWYSKWRSWSLGVCEAHFCRKDLWKVDLGKYDNIVIFGVEEMMQSLELKLENEMSATCCVVVCRFPLKNSKPAITIGHGLDRVWVYCKNSNHPP